MIGFECVSCDKHYEVNDELAGKKGRCKQCGAVFRIPETAIIAAMELPRAPQIARRTTASDPAPAPVQNVQVVVNQIDRKSTNALGVSGVVLGLIALSGSWIPLFGAISLPGILLGGVLSLVGLIVAVSSKRSGVGWPLAGVAINAAALVILVIVNVAFIGATASSVRAAREAERKAQQQAPPRPIPDPKAPGDPGGGDQP